MEIEKKIVGLIAEITNLPVQRISNNETLSSILYIELIVRLEEEYGIEFADDYLFYEGIVNIKELAKQIKMMLNPVEDV